ncbi:aldehyde dehydrogenase EutE, partial [Clostridium estertheticum]|nr:aldehyde dehydrogenase EutE [Clostridium estertheticum]
MSKDVLVSAKTEDLNVISNVEGTKCKQANNDNLYLGVFEDVEIAISKAIHAQKVLTIDYKEE